MLGNVQATLLGHKGLGGVILPSMPFYDDYETNTPALPTGNYNGTDLQDLGRVPNAGKYYQQQQYYDAALGYAQPQQTATQYDYLRVVAEQPQAYDVSTYTTSYEMEYLSQAHTVGFFINYVSAGNFYILVHDYSTNMILLRYVGGVYQGIETSFSAAPNYNTRATMKVTVSPGGILKVYRDTVLVKTHTLLTHKTGMLVAGALNFYMISDDVVGRFPRLYNAKIDVY